MGINIPGALTAANAVSFAKGQEVMKETSGETKEKNRLLRQTVVKQRMADEQNRTSGAGKSILA